MSLAVHKPYPGVALAVTEQGSVLFGAPADAFKATKQYCTTHGLAFPRVLVAPPQLLVEANPQFAPEFFLYDFLFVYGAAFKPELAGERLQLVVHEPGQIEAERRALQLTLTGPTRQEMAAYTTPDGSRALSEATVRLLADVSEHMAIKQDGAPRPLESMVEITSFDNGSITLLNGGLDVQRTLSGFEVRSGSSAEHIDLRIEPPVIPYATLPQPQQPQTPETFAIKALGTRSGFDLSGPTTGFLLWLNGRAVMYDGPVGSKYLLARQGISLDDVDAIILSHCHEDHMGAFTELILSGRKPKVYTAEPIYRSTLVKLARYFGMSEAEVAGFIDYHPVEPGEPIADFGATFEFFYTVHAIPTIGMHVRMHSLGGTPHSVQISGDTMHHDGLDKMRSEGILPADKYEQMRHLIPNAKADNALYLADVGEAIIHGHPQDWQDNPNRILYYHCSDNEHTRSFGHDLAVPGAVYRQLETQRLHPAVPGRLLAALAFLDFKDPAWLANILFRGRTRPVSTGEILVSDADQGKASQTFSVIISGTAEVAQADGTPLTTLGPGEFFGVLELVDTHGCYVATVTAACPMEIFAIDATLLLDYVNAAGLEAAVQRLWKQRPMVESASLFRRLDVAVRDRIAAMGNEESYGPGDVIVQQGTIGDDFFVL